MKIEMGESKGKNDNREAYEDGTERRERRKG